MHNIGKIGIICETFGGNIERFLEDWSGDIHMGDGLAKTVCFRGYYYMKSIIL